MALNANCAATLSGIGLECLDNIGGIKRVYIARKEDIASVTATDATGVSLITPAETGAKPFYVYEFRKATGGMTSTATIDDAAGVRYFTTEVTLQFNKMKTEKRLEINALTKGNFVAVVEDMMGQFTYLGFDAPVTATAATAQAGTAYGDVNGYTLTLTDISKDMPYQLAPTYTTGAEGFIETLVTPNTNE